MMTIRMNSFGIDRIEGMEQIPEVLVSSFLAHQLERVAEIPIGLHGW